MPSRIFLIVTAGSLPRSQYVFDERTTCLLGRDEDCDPRVPDDEMHRGISRLHCLLDINPPQIRIRDLGSKFGTFVNDTKIGQRQREEDRGKALFPERDLNDGDVVCLCDPRDGNPVIFRVAVHHEASAAGATERPALDADRMGIARRLLDAARTGRPDLRAIAGYTIERPLGEGSASAVYLARHEQSGDWVALKIMLPRAAATEQAIARFLREADNTRALRHRHIVVLRDAGCCDGVFFFTLDYCESGSVAGLMAEQGGTLAVEDAFDILLQALLALEYAHRAEVPVRLADGTTITSAGLVHRDLSPDNLLLTGKGPSRMVKIADFGLAHAFDQAGLSGLSRTGTTAGKPAFLPRQQVVNFKYAKPEVDVWALAACFYFMVTGESPRDFPEDRDPWRIVLDCPAVPIRQRPLGRRVAADLAGVIDHALTERPAIGFATAGEFRRALLDAIR
jgi:hypothetical protein